MKITEAYSQYADSNTLVLTGVPQILEGVRYSSTFSLQNDGHSANIREQVPVTE